MYMINGKPYITAKEFDEFIKDISNRNIMAVGDWNKLQDKEKDIAILDKKVEIAFVIMGFDYDEGINEPSQCIRYKGIDLRLYVHITNKDGDIHSNEAFGYPCYNRLVTPSEWFNGKPSYIFSNTPERIPRNHRIIEANLYVKGTSEQYKREQELKAAREAEKKYMDDLEKKVLKSVNTPWIKQVPSEKDKKIMKWAFTFDFMDNTVKIYGSDKISAIIMSNYLYELNANSLFSGMLDISNLKYVDLKKRNVDLEEYKKIKKYVSLEPLYGLVKDRILYVIETNELGNLVSLDLKKFLGRNMNNTGNAFEEAISKSNQEHDTKLKEFQIAMES